ncbi:cytochrome b561 domain-containing protein At2g30890-like isoform X2 [Musa acuminata AAA Group]|uniref:cytochrome b561 domain-containing protein At2g30890-like isoform X2 n=1 Tax=Musa acuminata AAA Group TaxID=214697 RepID=UPI0031D3CEC8
MILGNFVAASLLLLLPLLLHCVGSLRDTPRLVQSRRNGQPPNPLQITVHAFLLWVSVGFLMPVGIIIIRVSHRVHCITKLKALFYAHVIVQTVAILLATAAAVLSVINFENSFSNTHQRLGAALYALIWIQPVVAFLRPHRGTKLRGVWYLLHWLLGTGVCVLGVANVYIGLHTYRERSSRSVSLWASLLTAAVSIVAVVYLLQDKWEYLMKQARVGDEQVTPSPLGGSHKEINYGCHASFTSRSERYQKQEGELVVELQLQRR